MVFTPASGDGIYSCDMGNMVEAVWGNGVVTGLAVSEKSGTPNMSVDVAAGEYIANGTHVTKGSTTNVAITAAHATNDRIDIIVADSSGTISVVDGTAASPGTEKPPELPANKILFAVVFVEHSSSTVVNADITDKRIMTVGATRNSGYVSVVDAINMNSNSIINLADPTNDQDATTKKWVQETNDTVNGTVINSTTGDAGESPGSIGTCDGCSGCTQIDSYTFWIPCLLDPEDVDIKADIQVSACVEDSSASSRVYVYVNDVQLFVTSFTSSTSWQSASIGGLQDDISLAGYLQNGNNTIRACVDHDGNVNRWAKGKVNYWKNFEYPHIKLE